MTAVANINDGRYQGRYVLLAYWSNYSGYSRDAFNGKVRAGIWLEGKHWIKSPDGKIQVDWQAIEEWEESQYDQEFLQRARSLPA